MEAFVQIVDVFLVTEMFCYSSKFCRQWNLSLPWCCLLCLFQFGKDLKCWLLDILGIGIPKHKQSLLFQAFSQVESSTTRYLTVNQPLQWSKECEGVTSFGLILSQCQQHDLENVVNSLSTKEQTTCRLWWSDKTVMCFWLMKVVWRYRPWVGYLLKTGCSNGGNDVGGKWRQRQHFPLHRQFSYTTCLWSSFFSQCG